MPESSLIVPVAPRGAPDIRPATVRADSVQPDGRAGGPLRTARHLCSPFRHRPLRLPLRLLHADENAVSSPKAKILSLEELHLVAPRVLSGSAWTKSASAAASPSSEKGVVSTLQKISPNSPASAKSAVTTNGSQLPRHAEPLRRAGVRRINISLDTLDENKFKSLTRTGELSAVLRGIESARAAKLRRAQAQCRDDSRIQRRRNRPAGALRRRQRHGRLLH